MSEKQREILIKSLSWFVTLFILIFIGVNNIFADTFENIGYLNEDSYVNVRVGYTSQLLPLQRTNEYQLAQVEELYIEIENYNFQGGTTYAIEFYTANTPLKYVNSFGAYGETSSNEPVSCNVAGILSDNIQHLNFKFNCPKTVNYLKLNLFNSSSNYIMDSGLFSWNYVYLKKVLSSSGNEIIESQNAQIIQGQKDIINNQTQNTQDIINNNNTNTQNIIDNQNSNTDKEIESQIVCSDSSIDKNYIVEYDKALNNSGQLISLSGFGVTDYIKFSNTKYLLLKDRRNIGGRNFCFYDLDKQLIGNCIPSSNYNIDTEIPVPSNALYIRFTIEESYNLPQFVINSCKNGNQALNDSIEEQTKTSKGILGKIGDLFDNLFSNDDADISGLDNMVGWLPPGPVDSIINLPLSLFNSLTNTLSGTCTPVTLTLPFVNQNLTLPCFDAYMSQYVSGFNTLWTWVGVTVSVFILYRYLLNLYKWIDDTLTMRENNLPGYYDDNMWGGA